MCPHTPIRVSAGVRRCPQDKNVLEPLDFVEHNYMCPQSAISVSSYYHICVIILQYMCPQDKNVLESLNTAEHKWTKGPSAPEEAGQVYALLVLYWYKCTNTDAEVRCSRHPECAGLCAAQFTCFTGTKVHILTQKVLRQNVLDSLPSDSYKWKIGEDVQPTNVLAGKASGKVSSKVSSKIGEDMAPCSVLPRVRLWGIFFYASISYFFLMLVSPI